MCTEVDVGILAYGVVGVCWLVFNIGNKEFGWLDACLLRALVSNEVRRDLTVKYT